MGRMYRQLGGAYFDVYLGGDDHERGEVTLYDPSIRKALSNAERIIKEYPQYTEDNIEAIIIKVNNAPRKVKTNIIYRKEEK